MSLGSNIKRLLSDSAIYGLSGVLSRFISVFLTPIYTRIYTPDDYGVISVLTNGYILISILLVFSMDSATARWFYDVDNRESKKRVINTWIWFYLILSTVFGMILFLSAGFLQRQFLPDSPDSILYIRMISLNLPFVVCSTVAINVLRFELKAKYSVLLTLTQSLLLIGLNLLLVVVLRMGLSGIYLAQLIASLVVVPLAYYLIKDWIGSPWWFSRMYFPGMFRFALPVMPATLGYWVVNLSGVFFINEFLPKSQVGLYQIGISIASVAGLATTAFQQAWSPFAFSILDQPNSKKVFATALKVYVLLVGTFCMLISVFSYEALVILTTEAFYGASLVASILTFNAFLIGLSSISGLGAMVAKKTFPLGMITLVSAVMLVGLNLLLIPMWGIEGAAFAVCLSQLLVPCYMFWKSQRIFYIPFHFREAGLLIMLMMGAVGLTYFFRMEDFWHNLLVKIMVLALFFGIVGIRSRVEVLHFLGIIKNRAHVR